MLRHESAAPPPGDRGEWFRQVKIPGIRTPWKEIPRAIGPGDFHVYHGTMEETPVLKCTACGVPMAEHPVDSQGSRLCKPPPAAEWRVLTCHISTSRAIVFFVASPGDIDYTIIADMQGIGVRCMDGYPVTSEQHGAIKKLIVNYMVDEILKGRECL